jgi:hypothetical protein
MRTEILLASVLLLAAFGGVAVLFGGASPGKVMKWLFGKGEYPY